MTGDHLITSVGQAGDGCIKGPARRVLWRQGRKSDPTEAGQSSESLAAAGSSEGTDAGEGGGGGASSQQPAEGA